jgi:hypothetical protein
MQLPELLDEVGVEVQVRAAERAERDPSLLDGAETAAPFREISHAAKGLLCQGEELLAGVGELQAARGAREQRHFEALLEIADLFREAGLGDVVLCGGAGEGADLSCRDEVFELSDRGEGHRVSCGAGRGNGCSWISGT